VAVFGRCMVESRFERRNFFVPSFKKKSRFSVSIGDRLESCKICTSVRRRHLGAFFFIIFLNIFLSKIPSTVRAPRAGGARAHVRIF
jgi:hypothetical protein